MTHLHLKKWEPKLALRERSSTSGAGHQKRPQKMHQHEKQFTKEEIDENNKINERRKILDEILGRRQLPHLTKINLLVEKFVSFLR